MNFMVGFLSIVVMSELIGAILGWLMTHAAKPSRIDRSQMAFMSAKNSGH